MSGEDLVVTPGEGGVLLASSGEGHPVCAGQPPPTHRSPPTKNNPAQNSNRWETLI